MDTNTTSTPQTETTQNLPITYAPFRTDPGLGFPRSDGSNVFDLDVIPYFRGDNFLSGLDRTTPPRSARNPGRIRKYVSKSRAKTEASLTAMKTVNQEVLCGQRDLSYKMVRVGRIVGGETAGFSDWPWMAMLLNYGRPRCGN